jgi:hypothetical protein
LARGLLYAVAYFSAVIVCPILLLAAAMQMAMYRVFPSGK